VLVDEAGYPVLAIAGEDGEDDCLRPLRLPSLSEPVPTTRVVISGNLDAGAAISEAVPQFELDFPIVDDLGRTSTVHLSFTKVENGHWSYAATSDRLRTYGSHEWVSAGEGQLFFDDQGALLDAQLSPLQVGGGLDEAVELSFGSDIVDAGRSGFDGVTSFFAASAVTNVENDGFGWASTTGWNVDAEGNLDVQFGSGRVVEFGTLALARFPSEDHLTLGPDATWRETLASGTPVFGRPLAPGRGSVQ
jgi:flagellar hook protein FlgE